MNKIDVVNKLHKMLDEDRYGNVLIIDLKNNAIESPIGKIRIFDKYLIANEYIIRYGNIKYLD